jgi:hypothetical protein
MKDKYWNIFGKIIGKVIAGLVFLSVILFLVWLIKFFIIKIL